MSGDPDEPNRRHRYRTVAAFVVASPLVVLGVVVGGWPGVVLVLVFAAVIVAIALET